MKFTYRRARLAFFAPLATLAGWSFLLSALRHFQNLLCLAVFHFAKLSSLAPRAFVHGIRAAIKLNFSQTRFKAIPNAKLRCFYPL